MFVKSSDKIDKSVSVQREAFDVSNSVNVGGSFVFGLKGQFTKKFTFVEFADFGFFSTAFVFGDFDVTFADDLKVRR